MEPFSPLAQFITRLIHSPQDRKAFLKNREKAIEESGLSEEDRQVLSANKLSMLIDWLDPADDRPTPERQGGGGSGGSGSGGSGGSGG